MRPLTLIIPIALAVACVSTTESASSPSSIIYSLDPDQFGKYRKTDINPNAIVTHVGDNANETHIHRINEIDYIEKVDEPTIIEEEVKVYVDYPEENKIIEQKITQKIKVNTPKEVIYPNYITNQQLYPPHNHCFNPDFARSFEVVSKNQFVVDVGNKEFLLTVNNCEISPRERTIVLSHSFIRNHYHNGYWFPVTNDLRDRRFCTNDKNVRVMFRDSLMQSMPGKECKVSRIQRIE